MSPVELATSFVPLRLLSLMGDSALAIDVHGAVLAADLIDFTGLTEAFTQLAGKEGGEHVGHRLHAALAPAVDLVIKAGGDVVKFAGDGLLCVFPAPHDSAAQGAAEAVSRLEVQGPSGTLHRFRVSVVQGPLTLMRLGGHGGRYELVAAGPAVEQAQQALPDGATLQVLRLPSSAPCAVGSGPPVARVTRASSPLPDLRAFLPAYLRDRLTEDLAPWLREFRTLTLVFARFDVPADVAEDCSSSKGHRFRPDDRVETAVDRTVYKYSTMPPPTIIRRRHATERALDLGPGRALAGHHARTVRRGRRGESRNRAERCRRAQAVPRPGAATC